MATYNTLEIKRLVKTFWRINEFIQKVPIQDLPILPDYKQEELIPYEEYMWALPCVSDWETGPVFVIFPPEGAEDNELHTHPISDRIITVIKGSGLFIAVKDKVLQKWELNPGTRVYMPRGVLHTFLAGVEGLTVESIHNPYVPIGNSKTIFSPLKTEYHVKNII